MPPLNLSAKARLAVYIVTGVGSALVAYLVARDVIGDAEVTLWAAIAALVNGLAAINVSDRSTHLFLPDDRERGRGHVDLATALLVGVVALVVLALLGFFR
jgi:hypothetical protein